MIRFIAYAIRLVVQLLWVAAVLPVWAATYNLPGAFGTAPFASCSASTYNCSTSVTVGNGHTLNVASNITMNVAGSLALGNNVVINLAPGYTFTIIATGSISVGTGATLNANLQAGGSISTGSNSVVNGNIQAGGGASLGANGVVNGNVTAPGGISFGNAATTVNGICTPNYPRCLGAFSVTKVASAPSVPANTLFTYTLGASNTTSSAINSVVLTDDLATPGLSFISCTTASGSCVYSAGTVTWTLGNLAAGANATATLNVLATTAGAKTNVVVANTAGNPSATRIVQVYAPLADWRMDEASWNGTAGEVKDATGNGFNGRARIASGSTVVANTLSASPAFTSGARSTCNYGDFDRPSGPTRTNSYVELTGIPALPTSFTFAAWIRSTNPSQSGQRILVRDDAQNGWGFSLGDPGQAKIRFFNRNIQLSGAVSGDGSNGGCGVFCLDTAAVITANNWFFVAVTIDTSAKVITHYVFNASGTLVSNTSAAFTGTWQDGTGLAALGGETAASGEGSTPAFHFKGNIDEVQIYSGVRSQADLSLLLTRTRTCSGSQPDHLELVHDGSALTCAAKAVTVLACTSTTSCNGIAADQYTASTVTLTPTPISGAQWCSDAACASPISGAITVANNTVIYLKDTNARTDRLAGTTSSALTTALQCKNTSTNAFDATSACDMAFGSAGFIISNAPNGASSIVPAQTAGNSSGTYYLRAVRTSTTTKACEGALTGTTTVDWAAQCNNPSTCSSGNRMTLTANAASAIASNPGSGVTTSTPVNMTFDADGNAPFSFNYADVGLVTLHASKAAGGTLLTPLVGSSNPFVVKPGGFVLSGIRCTSWSPTSCAPALASPGNNPAAASAAGAAFIQAGQSFSATVTATTSGGSATPNYGKESSPETVTLAPTLVLPAGGANPAISNADAFGSFSGGVATGTTFAWPEVGIITLTPRVGDGDYLGAGQVTGTPSANVGRFIPAFFDTSVLAGCSAFTYSGQPMTVTATAKATGGGTTTNYSGANWARQLTLTDANGVAGSFTAGNTLPAASFSSGAASNSTTTFTFTSPTTAPSSIRLRASEPPLADGISSAIGTEGTQTIRSGRIRLQNAYGSELLATGLPLPTLLEYFDTAPSGWRAGTDTCTNLVAANFAFTAAAPSCSAAVAGCTTALAVTATGAGPYKAPWTVNLAKPTSAGSMCIRLNLDGTAAGNQCLATGTPGSAATSAAMPWLKFGWTGATPSNPAASVVFGSFKSPLIYRRENY